MFPNYQQYALNEQQRINKQVTDALVKKYSQEDLNTDDMSQEAVMLYNQLERKMSILISLLLEAMSHITDNPNYTYYYQDSLRERKPKRRRKIDEDQINEDQIDEDRITLRSGRRLRGSGNTKYNHDNVFVGTLQSIDVTLVDIEQIVNQLSQSFNSLERGQVIRIDNLLIKIDERIEDLVTIFSKAYSKTEINSNYKEDLIESIVSKYNSVNYKLTNNIETYSPVSNLDD